MLLLVELMLRFNCLLSFSDLVFIWSKLHMRLQTPNQVLLEEIQELMLTATNVNSIFPFIKVILEEVSIGHEEPTKM